MIKFLWVIVKLLLPQNPLFLQCKILSQLIHFKMYKPFTGDMYILKISSAIILLKTLNAHFAMKQDQLFQKCHLSDHIKRAVQRRQCLNITHSSDIHRRNNSICQRFGICINKSQEEKMNLRTIIFSCSQTIKSVGLTKILIMIQR